MHAIIEKFEGDSKDVPLATDEVNPGEEVKGGIMEDERNAMDKEEQRKNGEELLLAKSKDKEQMKVPNLAMLHHPLPFPQRIMLDNETKREGKFKRLLGKLEASLPFIQDGTQTTTYKKFLKNILSTKKEPEENASTNLTCATLQESLIPKLKDPSNFSIPCVIGGCEVGKALCDLGASVSIMPFSLCKKLGLRVPRPTSITVQMVDRLMKYLVGILEDVLVKIDHYFIPEDFLILDIEEDSTFPIILGKPFMDTMSAVFDVWKGSLILEISDEAKWSSISSKWALTMIQCG